MKKLFIIVFVLLVASVIQSCVLTSQEHKSVKHFEPLAQANPGNFIKHGFVGIKIKCNPIGEIEIREVVDGSPAQKEGIRQGDIIIEIDGIPAPRKYQVFQVCHSKKPGDSLIIVLKRRNELLTKRLNLTTFYTPTVFYRITEMVYRDVPVRVAVIPTSLSLPSLLEKARKYANYERQLKSLFEGALLQVYKERENLAIIDRQHTEKVLDEIKFQQSGLVKDESRIKIGQMLGVTHLLLVNLSIELRGGDEALYSLWLELIEVESNKKIATSLLVSFKKSLGKEFSDYLETSDVRNDLLSYAERINEFKNMEKVITTSYASVTGKNFKDQKIFAHVMRETVIPKFAELLTGLKSITPATWKVKSTHKLLLDSVSLRYEALQEMLEAIETNNESMYSNANKKVALSKQLIKEYDKQYEDLIDKYISRFNKNN